VDAVIDELTEVTEHVPTFAEGDAWLTAALTDACISAAENAAQVINNFVLWSYKDVLDLGRRMVTEMKAPARSKPAKKARSNASQASAETVGAHGAEAVEEEYARSVSVAVDTVVARREKLLDILLTWLQSGDEAVTDEGLPAVKVQRALRVEAYKVISALRSFFPERETHYKHIDRLAYRPSSEVLGGIRKVFESEGARIRAELSVLQSEDPDNEEAAAALSRSLISCVLQPVSQNLIYDVDNLNRKQAAAVIYYVLDSNPVVEENIKGFMRQLKDSSLKKYLEIQLVALRDLYERSVAVPLQARVAAETAAEDGEETDFDFEDSDRMLEEGYAKVDLLSRKLAQSLGVGKLKEDALETLMQFLKASLDYAVKEVANAGFAGCLLNYLRFLLPPQQRETQSYLERAIESNPDMVDALEEQRERGQGGGDEQQGRYVGFAKLVEFAERLQGKSRPKMSRRKPSNAASHRLSHSMEVEQSPARGRASTTGAGAGGLHRGNGVAPARHSGAASSQFASQALLDEDLELIGRGRSANIKGAGSQVVGGRVGKVTQMKSQSQGNGAGQKKGKKIAAEEVSDEEEVQSLGEGQGGAGDSVDDGYEGLGGGAGRRYQQRFTQGLSTQPTQSQAAPVSQKSVAKKAAVTKAGPARTAPMVVMGLDIEDISEDEEDAQRGAKRGKGTASGRVDGGSAKVGAAGRAVGKRTSASSRVSDDIDEDSDAESEESSVKRGPPASKKRPHSSVRSAGSSGSDGRSAADSFAELDSIPSRRSLRH
jgi:hypothetical protein